MYALINLIMKICNSQTSRVIQSSGILYMIRSISLEAFHLGTIKLTASIIL